jgi:YVTN family beta-propeller protein
VSTQTGETVASLVVGTEPEGCRVSPEGRWVYITSETSNVVSVIVVAEIAVGQRPWGLAITPDGKKVYAACGGADPNRPGANEVTVIDAETNAVVARINAGDGPWGVAVGP